MHAVPFSKRKPLSIEIEIKIGNIYTWLIRRQEILRFRQEMQPPFEGCIINGRVNMAAMKS